MNTKELQKLIRSMVLVEVKELVPEMVKDVMAHMLMEVAVKTPSKPVQDNSHKRRALQEVSYSELAEVEDYPTLDRRAIAEKFGYEAPTPRGAIAPNGKKMIVSTAITENGTDIPVDPNDLPEELVHALTRDYTDVIKAWDKKRG